MRQVVISIVVLVVCCFVTVGKAYPETITTTSPWVNMPYPKDDPRWAEAFTHWDRRADTKEVMAAVSIFDELGAQKPDQIVPQLWVLRSNYLAAMRNRKKRDFYVKKAIAAGDRALKIEPDNIYATYWRAASIVLLRDPTDEEYLQIRAFNARFKNRREIPAPKDDPLWAKAMKLWDTRFTEQDVKYAEAKLGGKTKLVEEDVKSGEAKGAAVVAVFEQLEKKYPARIEPKLWLARANYWTSQVCIEQKKRATWSKAAASWGHKAIEMEPRNPAANFWTAVALSEYGGSTSLIVLTRYSREIGRQMQFVTEEDPGYMYGGFSRFFAGAIAFAGELVIKVAELLGFPKELIERLTVYAVKTDPDYLQNYYMMGLLYLKTDRKVEARKMFDHLLKADPVALKYQEAENRLIQFVAKLAMKDLFE